MPAQYRAGELSGTDHARTGRRLVPSSSSHTSSNPLTLTTARYGSDRAAIGYMAVFKLRAAIPPWAFESKPSSDSDQDRPARAVAYEYGFQGYATTGKAPMGPSWIEDARALRSLGPNRQGRAPKVVISDSGQGVRASRIGVCSCILVMLHG